VLAGVSIEDAMAFGEGASLGGGGSNYHQFPAITSSGKHI
jgi:hypothetical protein